MKSIQEKSTELVNALTLKQSGLIKTENGFAFRDLNKNGKLDIYEDPRQPIEARVEDLLGADDPGRKSGADVHQRRGGQRGWLHRRQTGCARAWPARL